MPRRSASIYLPAPANDNDEPKDAPTGISSWPSVVPVTAAELRLLETYMADLVSEIVANDNEPPESEESP